MALKTTGLMIPLEAKLLIVRDSVMGCLSSARRGDSAVFFGLRRFLPHRQRADSILEIPPNAVDLSARECP